MLGNGFGGFHAHGHRRRPAVGDTVPEEAGRELFVVQRLNADRINPVVPCFSASLIMPCTDVKACSGKSLDANALSAQASAFGPISPACRSKTLP